MARFHASRDHLAHDFVEGDEAGRIALAQEDQRERRGQTVGVGALGKPVRCAPPRHGAARVEKDHGPEVCFLFELLHEQPVRSRENLPIEIAEFVSRLISAVLSKFH